MAFFLALDEGTTSCRAIVFDERGRVCALAQRPLKLHAPRPGWVEQDARDIWTEQCAAAREAIRAAGLSAQDIRAIGLANQRETTVLWDKATGEPIAPAIVWQDRRTQPWCERFRASASLIEDKTGLTLDAYFSASKLAWLLDQTPFARARAQKGELAFGTVDAWLMWNLCGEHVTDVSNASRTLLFNLDAQSWDEELLAWFDAPASVLPGLSASGSLKGYTKPEILGAAIPVYAILGDQQAALFGHGCTQHGMGKCTYGTGCFVLINTQTRPHSQHHLLSTVAWQEENQPAQFALEGSVFMGGAVVQWLRDNLGMIDHSAQIESLAAQVSGSQGVVLVPAFTGLGAPHWRPEATASLTGLTRATDKGHVARAALESIAFQVSDVLGAMNADMAAPLTELRVDGGASRNAILMQFQADMLNAPVVRSAQQEITAQGAAAMAAVASGLLTHDEIGAWWLPERVFEPTMSDDERQSHLYRWRQALARTI